MIRFSWLVISSNIRDIKASKVDPFGKKDAHQKRLGQLEVIGFMKSKVQLTLMIQVIRM